MNRRIVVDSASLDLNCLGQVLLTLISVLVSEDEIKTDLHDTSLYNVLNLSNFDNFEPFNLGLFVLENLLILTESTDELLQCIITRSTDHYSLFMQN